MEVQEFGHRPYDEPRKKHKGWESQSAFCNAAQPALEGCYFLGLVVSKALSQCFQLLPHRSILWAGHGGHITLHSQLNYFPDRRLLWHELAGSHQLPLGFLLLPKLLCASGEKGYIRSEEASSYNTLRYGSRGSIKALAFRYVAWYTHAKISPPPALRHIVFTPQQPCAHSGP